LPFISLAITHGLELTPSGLSGPMAIPFGGVLFPSVAAARVGARGHGAMTCIASQAARLCGAREMAIGPVPATGPSGSRRALLLEGQQISAENFHYPTPLGKICNS